MANSQSNVALDLLRRQLDKIEDSLNANEEVLSQLGGEDGRPPMANTDERIGRIEGAIEGLKHSQNLMVVTVLGIGTILAGLGVYGLQRIDTLSDRVNALPSQINSELLNLTKTLASLIIATKENQSATVPTPAPQKH
jgi:predicted RND superfamily exporter protein